MGGNAGMDYKNVMIEYSTYDESSFEPDAKRPGKEQLLSTNVYNNWNRYTDASVFAPSIVKRPDFGIFAGCIPTFYGECLSEGKKLIDEIENLVLELVRLLNFFADAFGAVTDGVTIWFIRARVVKTVKDKIVWSSFKTIDYNSIVDDKKSISYFD
jgi:hypothetical protein